MTDKYAKRGLAIIGVSDESKDKVASYIESKGVKYIIALGGAPGYKTSGIPHAWLVNPKGMIVWDGHPGNLKDPEIEEHLKGVSLTPTFTLPKELKSAEKSLNSGSFGDGMKALETHLKKPKSPQTEAAAKEAIEKVKAYADSQAKQAETLEKEKYYAEAAVILQGIEKAFKGTQYGTKAKDKLAEWKKDKTIKLELDGSALVAKADAMAQAKQYKNAAQLLLQITKGKKYEGTKVREVAETKLKAVEKKL